MNVDRYSEEFETLTFSNPADGVLQITMEGTRTQFGRSAQTPAARDVWSAIDRDPTCGWPCWPAPARAFRPVAASNCSMP
jgi:hypothetical protein